MLLSSPSRPSDSDSIYNAYALIALYVMILNIHIMIIVIMIKIYYFASSSALLMNEHLSHKLNYNKFFINPNGFWTFQ